MRKMKNFTPYISWYDFFVPVTFMENWAMLYFMHEILLHDDLWCKTFIFMKGNFISMNENEIFMHNIFVPFSCMKPFVG